VKRSSSCLVLLAALALSACGVDDPPASTGGAGPLPSGQSCPRGYVVVTSDYVSTNVALTRLDGTTLSESLLSSAARPTGLAAALSGDVDIPTSAPASGRVVLLDRFGTNVLTWLDPSTGAVQGQLPVGQGFESNPHDYLEVDERRAYVTRNNTNPTPGKEAHDEGDDVLLIDTVDRKILGRIPMPKDVELLPRASGMTRIKDHVVVVLQRLSLDFSKAGSSVLVGIDPATDAVAWQVEVAGLQSCGRVAPSPDGSSFALACAGRYDSATNSFDPSVSDVVLFEATAGAPIEKRRLGLPAKLGVAVQSVVAYASTSTLITSTHAAGGDELVHVNLSSGDTKVLKVAAKQYSLGGVRCAPGCGDICVVADASAGKLLRFQIEPKDGSATELESLQVDQLIGLPPRTLGLF
jgi:hypothetical protein